jgi:hypothetical protein
LRVTWTDTHDAASPPPEGLEARDDHALAAAGLTHRTVEASMNVAGVIDHDEDEANHADPDDDDGDEAAAKRQASAPVGSKPYPETSTIVPPAVLPEAGMTDVTVGRAAYRKASGRE